MFVPLQSNPGAGLAQGAHNPCKCNARPPLPTFWLVRLHLMLVVLVLGIGAKNYRMAKI